jgi:predicted AlkP superfamily phosphohydrolase/phosphomutase
MAGNKLLFIGLDAGDADLIERWLAEGRLPNIARLKANGAWARLQTTAEVFHVSAWPSIFTGAPADRHGLYHAYVTRPGHQGLMRPRPDESPVPFLWKTLSDHGTRSIVVDAFLTCPLRPFNGVQIVDWGSWSWFWEPTTIPESLKGDIRRRFGAYPADDHSKVGMTPVTDIATFRRRLLAGVEKKTEVVTWLMQQQAWDFFLVVFGEAHPAGHYFWHLYDETYLTHPGGAATELHDALRDVYVALDAAIGRLIDRVDADTTIMLVSGDGMAANYSGSHILADILTRMRILNDTTGDGAAQPQPAASTSLLGTVRNMVPESFRNFVSRMVLSRQVQEQLSLRWKSAGIAWPRTRAYVMENANEGYIRVNLAGREPEGIVSPGAEYDALCDELCRMARALVNPATGKPAALGVYRIDEIFKGPRRSHMPDVVITWDLDARVTTELLTEACGIVRVDQPACGIAPYYTGNHWPNAFAAVTGPGVPAGATLEGRSILDLAPTILAHFGIAPSGFMEGVVRPEWGAGPR